jgi:hypothetical protein
MWEMHRTQVHFTRWADGFGLDWERRPGGAQEKEENYSGFVFTTFVTFVVFYA